MHKGWHHTPVHGVPLLRGGPNGGVHIKVPGQDLKVVFFALPHVELFAVHEAVVGVKRGGGGGSGHLHHKPQEGVVWCVGCMRCKCVCVCERERERVSVCVCERG